MIDDALIVADFSTVPDKIPPIPAGIYDFTIDNIEKKAPKTPTDGSAPSQGYNIVVAMHISGPAASPNVNRKMTQYLWISQDPSITKEQRDLNLMAVKRFDKACGGNPEASGSVNVNNWIGKVIKAMVKGDIYQGRETSKIDRVFIPGDPELAV